MRRLRKPSNIHYENSMSSKQINWGILGTSKISTVMAKAIQASSTSELVGVGSRTQANADNFAQEYAIPKAYGNFELLLNDPEIDAIYIGLPNHLHKEWILRCADAGKHILCDKPFVTNVDDANEIFDHLKTKKVFFMEGLMYRCHPFIIKLRELFQQKIIGDIRLYNATYMADIVGVANPTIGGRILSLGCYPVSLVLLLATIDQGVTIAEPVAMTALGRMDEHNHNDRQASALLKFANGSQAMITVADDAGMYSQFDVYGTLGAMHFATNPWLPDSANNKIIITLRDQTDPIEIVVTAEKPLYTYEIDVMNENIIHNRTSATQNGISWEDSLATMSVMHAWREAIKQ
jgi:predicted dehydrogenase